MSKTIVGERALTVTTEPNPSRLDVVMGVLSVLLVGGFFVDLWAHSHGRVDESFFTPWHGILYLAAGLFGGVLLALTLRNRRNGASIARASPRGYDLALLGAGLFLAAGLADMVWHGIYGIEEDIEALLSPTHLALAASGIMMVFGPVRSAWLKGPPVAFPRWLPWVAGLTMGLAILFAFTQYANSAIDTWPEQPEAISANRSDLLIVSADGRQQTRVPVEGSEQVWMPDFSADGRIVVGVISEDVTRLVVMDADGSNQRVIHEGEGRFPHADWSPDGTMIAFNAEIDGSPEIFVVAAEGGEPTRLTEDPAFDWGPAWSPDGAEIVFTSNRDGDSDLYLMAATGGEPRQLTDLPGSEAGASFSPDGRWIVFDTTDSGDADIALIRPDGSGMVTLTSDDAFDSAPAWSPDGSRISFASDRGGEVDLYVMATDGSAVRNLTEDPSGHEGWAGSSWSPDGSLLATNTSGHLPFWAEPFVREALGVSALLIQATLLAGFLLLILRHGPIPVGSVTFIVGVSGSIMTVISDNYWYIVVAFAAGVIGDLIVVLLRPSTDRTLALRFAGFLIPAIWYAAYLLALGVWGDGIGWSVHMTVGAPFLAGAAGLLLTFLAFPTTNEA
jgi:hypothetical protein